MGKNKQDKKVKLSILMPVLNEGVNLKIMLKILEATIEVPHEILVIYDSLDDDSVPVVKEIQKTHSNIKSVHNKLGKGVINAIKAGVNEAAGSYVLVIAADDVGPVLTIEQMLHLMDEGCDFVSATRYAFGGRVLGGTFTSRLLSKIANRLFHIISGSAFTDLTLGVKMFRRSIFNKLNLQAKPVGWAVAFEMAIKAQLLGLKLGEVPIISINRFYGGKSSFKLGSWVIEYSRWFLWGLKELSFSSHRNAIALRILSEFGKIRKK